MTKRRRKDVYEPARWDPEEHGARHLHMGMLAPDAVALIAWLEKNYGEDAPPVYINGDGWNCWGEEVGTDVNDDVTHHVVIPVANPHAGQHLVADLLDSGFPDGKWSTTRDTLRPIRDHLATEDVVDVIAVVTDGVDWAEYAHDLSWEYATHENPIPSGVYVSTWPRGRKAYSIEVADEDTAELEDWIAAHSAEIVDVVDIQSGHPRRQRA